MPVTKCCVPYPTQDDAATAAICLHEMASGSQPFDAACAKHCGWVIQGYLNSQEAPPTVQCDKPTAANLVGACQPCVDAKTGKITNKAAINWLQIFQQIMLIVLSLIPANQTPAKP